MIEKDPEAQDARAEGGQARDDSRRARYQRPVLAHLGSVNRLTLSASAPSRGDGSQFLKVGT
jgi:hypothetical protein